MSNVTPSDDLILVPRAETPSRIRFLWMSPAAVVPSRSRRVVVAVLMVIGAVAVAWSGAVHLKLWHEENGYAQLPVVGKLFLLQGIACLVLAVGIIVLRRLVFAVLGAALMAASIGAGAISINGTLFGYHEYSDSPYVGSSLLVESTAIATLVTAVIVALTASRPRA
jgi:hypothetical protein